MCIVLDVYSVFKAYESIATGLTDEQKRFLEWQIRDGERNGLHLPENIREEVMELKKRLSQLSVDYQSNLNEESTVLYFSRKELEGMPENFFDGLKQVSIYRFHFFSLTFEGFLLLFLSGLTLEYRGFDKMSNKNDLFLLRC